MFSAALAAASIVLGACEADLDIDNITAEQQQGSADFSSYVAIGNSLTAGFADGALNRSGQEASYPAIIAQQIQQNQPELTFNQPLLPEGLAAGTIQLDQLIPSPTGGTPSPVFSFNRPDDVDTASLFAPVAPPASGFQNLGVPGLRMVQVGAVGYGNPAAGPGGFNPYFTRFATNPATSSVLSVAVAQAPSFVSIWLGNNDVLGYATSGGTGSISPDQLFEASLASLMDSLRAANANVGGVIANIPNVENIPFFQVVPWNGFVLQRQGQVDTINASIFAGYRAAVTAGVTVVVEQSRPLIEQGVALAVSATVARAAVIQSRRDNGADSTQAVAFADSDEGQTAINNLATDLREDDADAGVQGQYDAAFAAQVPLAIQGQIDAEVAARTSDAALDALRDAGFYPTFQVGPNGFLVASSTSPTTFVQLNSSGRITLPAATVLQNPALFGSATAQFGIIVPNDLALDQFEVEEVKNATARFNTMIADAATANNFVLVDMNAYFDELVTTGITAQGLSFSNSFITGNAFSLDGVHLTPRGYALVANRFIEEINRAYGARLQPVTLSEYRTVPLP